MAWREVSIVSARFEFCGLAAQEGANMSELCRRYGISRKTGYKWLGRYRAERVAGLTDRPRRPKRSPRRCSEAIELAVLAERDAHPVWGGRKLRTRLAGTPIRPVPAASTITAILRRHGRIDPAASDQRRALTRFEHEQPNDLWQMDYKGHFPVQDGRCHPLTVLDDHSRFSLGVRACRNEQTQTVRDQLTPIFRQYGLPRRMLMDNGPPFGTGVAAEYTPLNVWLIRLGIRVTHGRPYHPQTQGKDERFHRTLKAELLTHRPPERFEHCQPLFDRWRDEYNLQRPHEALGMEVPASRYRSSPRCLPETLRPIEYGPGDSVRRVQQGGCLHFRGRELRMCKAFCGQPVGLRPTQVDGVWEVYFCDQRVGWFDVRSGLDRLQPAPPEDCTELTDFTKKKEQKES